MVSICYEKEHFCACAYDGEKKVGECSYKVLADDWVIDHTYVEDAYRDQGIAGKLVDCLVEEAGKAGVDLLATCSYARDRLREKRTSMREEKKRQGEKDLLDLLGKVPGKVSDLQDEIDMMKRRKRK